MNETPEIDIGPRFSSSGNRIYWRRQKDSMVQLMTRDLESNQSSEALLFKSRDIQAIIPSPFSNDDRVLFTAAGNKSGQYGIWMIEAPHTAPLCLINPSHNVSHFIASWMLRNTNAFIFVNNERDPHKFDFYEFDFDKGTKLLYQNPQPGFIGSPILLGEERLVFIQYVDGKDTIIIDVNMATRNAEKIEPSGKGQLFKIDSSFASDKLLVLTDIDWNYKHIGELDLVTGNIDPIFKLENDVEGFIKHDQNTLFVNVSKSNGSELYSVRKNHLNWQSTKLYDYDNQFIGVRDIGIASHHTDTHKIAINVESTLFAPHCMLFDIPSNDSPLCYSGIHFDMIDSPLPTKLVLKSKDNLSFEAWLYESHQPDGAIVIFFHGGPEAQFRPDYNPKIQALLKSGFNILAPNIRGSTGYGKEFQAADDGVLRENILFDVEACLDFIESKFVGKVFLCGNSYGGYVSIFSAIKLPKRLSGAISVSGFFDLPKFLQDTSAFRRAHREAEYGSLKNDLKNLCNISPFYEIQALQIPILLFHGTQDVVVPCSQSEALHKKAMEFKKCTSLTLLPNEGHNIDFRTFTQNMLPLMKKFFSHDDEK